MFDELLVDLTSGHNIRATVYSDHRIMYRAAGPEEMKSVGEVEFVNGVAAMGASGLFGDIKVCAGIVGNADLRLGDTVEKVLEAHIGAGGGRYRGVRNNTFFDSDPTLYRIFRNPPGLFQDEKYRAGFRQLHRFGLSSDIAVWEPQLPDVIDLASAFPDTPIILNHLGMPLGIGGYKGQREERYPLWRDNMRALARRENVVVKVGGLGTVFSGFPSFNTCPQKTSEELAMEWKPYIETCIELFGADRCMFESNFPIDSASCTYRVLWNVFKRVVAGYSQHEKSALFYETATRVYRLDI